MYTRAELAGEYSEDRLAGRTFRCTHCGEECEAEYVDNGIGAYEYWGAPGRHTQIDLKSVCCGKDVEEY